MDSDRTLGLTAAQETELITVSANDTNFAALYPVHTLVLDTGATRIKRKGERKKPDELWQGVGFAPHSPTDGVPLYVRVGPSNALVAELLCGVLARALKLPAPDVYLVQIPPGRMPRSKLVYAKDTILCVGTRDIGGDTFAQLLAENPRAVAPLLREWPELAKVTAFDEWLANPDRNMGNLLYVAQTIFIIDHAEAFGGSTRALYPLAELTDVQFTNLLGGLVGSLEAKKHPSMLEEMRQWLAHTAAATDIPNAVECAQLTQWIGPEQKRELIDFVTKRLTITHTLLCQRLGHPQLTLVQR